MAEPNVTCPICGKAFHAPPSHLKNYKVICCSMDCSKKWRAELMRGEGNHQYGLKGDKNASFKGAYTKKRNGTVWDVFEYCPNHPYANKSGRVKLHRLIVEQNHDRFADDCFDIVDGGYFLKKKSLRSSRGRKPR